MPVTIIRDTAPQLDPAVTNPPPKVARTPAPAREKKVREVPGPAPVPRAAADLIAPYFDLVANRRVPGMTFEEYEKIPAVNATLLRNATPYEMLHYLQASSVLPLETLRLLNLQEGTAMQAVAYMQELSPKKVPRNHLVPGRQPDDGERLTDKQSELVDQVHAADEPVDMRDFPAASVTSCLARGLVRLQPMEILEDAVKPEIKESRALALAIGDATHKAILEPHMFDQGEWEKHWQLSPTVSITSAAALAALAANPHLRLITPEIVDTARRCRDAVWKHKECERLLELPGDSEVSFETWDARMQVRKKFRIDRLPHDKGAPVLDVKTTHGNVLKHVFKKSIYEFGYHVQDAFYTDSLAEFEGAPRPGFSIIAVTKKAPFIARLFELNAVPEDVSLYVKGKEIYEERMAAFVLAYHEKTWSAYEDEGSVLMTERA
jgi:hypothetical protein